MFKKEFYKELKNILVSNGGFYGERKEIVDFLTVGERFDVSTIFYGLSDKSLSFIKKELGKDFSFLIKEEILSRIEYFTLCNSKECIKPKLIVNFCNKSEYLEEEKELLVKFFSFYGNYDKLYIESYINKGRFLPPLVVSKIQELEAEISIVERLAVLGNINNIVIMMPFVYEDIDETKRFSFVFIDEEKEWPDDLNIKDYQVHILDTTNDFTVKYFFENMDKLSSLVSNIFDLSKKTSLNILVDLSFFSFIDKEKIYKDSRSLDELGVQLFPGKMKDFNDKYCLKNLIITSSLFIRARELNCLVSEYLHYLKMSLGEKGFEKFCVVSFNKLSNLSEKLSILDNLKEEYKNMIDSWEKIDSISSHLNNFKNQETDENLIGKLLPILDNIISTSSSIVDSSSPFLSKIIEIYNMLRESLSERKNPFESLFGLKQFSTEDKIVDNISELVRGLTDEFVSKEEITNILLKVFKASFGEPSLCDEKTSKDILDFLKRKIFSLQEKSIPAANNHTNPTNEENTDS